jgi:glycosyltransferase involved in cell wall biosynthesis
MKMDNSENPKVCVVMPVYNGAKTIELALKSLFYQTYSNWNCVIVNDGSTDGTKEILDKIKDIRFKIIHLERNRGRGFARQVCLDNATGDYLTYLDADDFYHPDKINEQLLIFKTNLDISLVSSGQGSFDNENQIKSIRGLKYSGEFTYNIGDEVKFISVTSMIKLREALSFNYNNILNASEDVDFFSKYLDNKKFYILNKILYYYYEYESVSYLKTIEYNYFRIIRIALMFKRDKAKTIIQLIKAVIKTLIYIVLIPILGKDFFIKRRGYLPTKVQTEEFNSHLLTLLKSRQ